MTAKARRQAYYTDCEHASQRQCHAVNTATLRNGERWQHRYYQWHLEINGTPTDDGPFASAREARAFRDGQLCVSG